jgi:hypothetical protein
MLLMFLSGSKEEWMSSDPMGSTQYSVTAKSERKNGERDEKEE